MSTILNSIKKAVCGAPEPVTGVLHLSLDIINGEKQLDLNRKIGGLFSFGIFIKIDNPETFRCQITGKDSKGSSKSLFMTLPIKSADEYFAEIDPKSGKNKTVLESFVEKLSSYTDSNDSIAVEDLQAQLDTEFLGCITYNKGVLVAEASEDGRVSYEPSPAVPADADGGIPLGNIGDGGTDLPDSGMLLRAQAAAEAAAASVIGAGWSIAMTITGTGEGANSRNSGEADGFIVAAEADMSPTANEANGDGQDPLAALEALANREDPTVDSDGDTASDVSEDDPNALEALVALSDQAKAELIILEHHERNNAIQAALKGLAEASPTDYKGAAKKVGFVAAVILTGIIPYFAIKAASIGYSFIASKLAKTEEQKEAAKQAKVEKRNKAIATNFENTKKLTFEEHYKTIDMAGFKAAATADAEARADDAANVKAHAKKVVEQLKTAVRQIGNEQKVEAGSLNCHNNNNDTKLSLDTDESIKKALIARLFNDFGNQKLSGAHHTDTFYVVSEMATQEIKESLENDPSGIYKLTDEEIKKVTAQRLVEMKDSMESAVSGKSRFSSVDHKKHVKEMFDFFATESGAPLQAVKAKQGELEQQRNEIARLAKDQPHSIYTIADALFDKIVDVEKLTQNVENKQQAWNESLESVKPHQEKWKKLKEISKVVGNKINVLRQHKETRSEYMDGTMTDLVKDLNAAHNKLARLEGEQAAKKALLGSRASLDYFKKRIGLLAANRTLHDGMSLEDQGRAIQVIKRVAGFLKSKKGAFDAALNLSGTPQIERFIEEAQKTDSNIVDLFEVTSAVVSMLVDKAKEVALSPQLLERKIAFAKMEVQAADGAISHLYDTDDQVQAQSFTDVQAAQGKLEELSSIIGDDSLFVDAIEGPARTRLITVDNLQEDIANGNFERVARSIKKLKEKIRKEISDAEKAVESHEDALSEALSLLSSKVKEVNSDARAIHEVRLQPQLSQIEEHLFERGTNHYFAFKEEYTELIQALKKNKASRANTSLEDMEGKEEALRVRFEFDDQDAQNLQKFWFENEGF